MHQPSPEHLPMPNPMSDTTALEAYERRDSRAPRVSVLVTYDSDLMSTRPIVDALRAQGWIVDYGLYDIGRNGISERQAAAAGLKQVPPRLTRDDLAESPLVRDSQLLIMALGGNTLRDALMTLRDINWGLEPRPITLTLYNGLIFANKIHGMMSRMGSDIVLLNSPADFSFYVDLARDLGITGDNALCFGVGTLAGLETRTQPAHVPPRSVVFAEQVVVPETFRDRAYLVDRIIEYADRFPKRRVLIKPRTRPGEKTSHPVKHHIEHLLQIAAQRRGLPPNLAVTHEPMAALIQSCDLLLTVSSTAAFEAIMAGTPVGILTDCGISDKLGNTFFIGSGLLTSFDRLTKGHQPHPDLDWCMEHVLAPDETVAQVVERINVLLAAQSAGGEGPLAFHPGLRVMSDISRRQYLDRTEPGFRGEHWPVRSHAAMDWSDLTHRWRLGMNKLKAMLKRSPIGTTRPGRKASKIDLPQVSLKKKSAGAAPAPVQPTKMAPTAEKQRESA
ncbi:MAG: hypothetical protein Alpg2KO_07140 [Alphaproteobacteria bacterium]